MIFFITVNVLGLLPYCNNTSSLSQGVHAEVYITVVKKRYNSRYTLEDLFDKIPTGMLFSTTLSVPFFRLLIVHVI